MAYVIVGALIVTAAVQFEPNASAGLDGALRALAGQPFGQWLLSCVAAGFIAYGAYAACRAKYGEV